jgi:hypothetical protein
VKCERGLGGVVGTPASNSPKKLNNKVMSSSPSCLFWFSFSRGVCASAPGPPFHISHFTFGGLVFSGTLWHPALPPSRKKQRGDELITSLFKNLLNQVMEVFFFS